MNLLVPVDLSEHSSRLIIDHAKKLAVALSGKIWLLHVADPDPEFVGYEVGPQTERDNVAKKYREEHRQLQHFAEELRAAGSDCTALLVQGATVDKILSEAARLPADMIAVGSHGKGMLRRLLVGSTSEGILRKSTVPVVVIPTHRLD